eukprot:1692785-Amphidinium_carterae.1
MELWRATSTGSRCFSRLQREISNLPPRKHRNRAIPFASANSRAPPRHLRNLACQSRVCLPRSVLHYILPLPIAGTGSR